MARVRAALERYGSKPKVASHPVRHERPVARDTAIRKPLTSHGNPCVGWNCSHFLNKD